MNGKALRYILCAISLLFVSLEMRPCTSAIISAEMNPSGRPILWKHRDTSGRDNRVEYIPANDGSYAFVGLFNSRDTRLSQAWMGMNEVGFAIMNTASYNLNTSKTASSKKDREGYVMSLALQKCKSVDDFAHLLDSLPRPLGVEANFGVVDAAGNGAFFETNNQSYTRFDLKDSDNGVLVRTNFSEAGHPVKGKGYSRYDDARELLAPYIAEKAVTPEVLTEILSRSFYSAAKGKDFSCDSIVATTDSEFIPRSKSTASIAIEGCIPVESTDSIVPGELVDEYIMWTALGYPPCAETVPVWCRPDGVDIRLRGTLPGGKSVLCEEAYKKMNEVFFTKKGSKSRYIDMRKLFNDEGTGYVQTLRRKNHFTYETTRRNNARSAAIVSE